MERLVHMAAIMTLALSVSTSGNVAACWDAAAQVYGVDPWLLYGIAKVESSLDPHALNLSHLQRTGSYDIGLMQINSRNLPTLAVAGIAPEHLWDSCTSIHVGARILREKIDRHGDNWEAVGAYNASCTRLKGAACSKARRDYAWKVYRAIGRALR
jgi:soluble lytic murein transglycosylase-like protein